MEVPVPAPAVADSIRSIRVCTYAPTPAGTKPRLPDALIEMFLHELSREPHHNRFYCDRCGMEYTIAVRSEGTACTQRPEGGFLCQGKITRDWTREKAHAELLRLMSQGGVAIAWELEEPSVLALAVCEAHRSDTVIRVLDFPMTVLGDIYGRLGREEPFLVLTHMSLVGITDAQRAIVGEKLVKDATESMMGLNDLTQATILVPVSKENHSRERHALNTMLGGEQMLLARDQRPNRDRELWGVKLCAR